MRRLFVGIIKKYDVVYQIKSKIASTYYVCYFFLHDRDGANHSNLS